MGNNVNKMIGMLGKPKSGMMKDSDGDKVPNMLDCKPYDKTKQGFIHKARGKIFGRTEEQQIKHEGEEREAKFIRRQKASEERRRQAELTAVEREKVKGEFQRKRQRTSVMGGGALGALLRTADGRPGNAPRRIKRITKRRKGSSKPKYVIVGGKAVQLASSTKRTKRRTTRRTTRVTRAPAPRQVPDISSVRLFN